MQLLINAIADKVANKLLLKTDIVNQFLNDSSKAASAALAYSLKQTTDTLNSNLANLIKCETITATTDSNGLIYSDIDNTHIAVSAYAIDSVITPVLTGNNKWAFHVGNYEYYTVSGYPFTITIKYI